MVKMWQIKIQIYQWYNFFFKKSYAVGSSYKYTDKIVDMKRFIQFSFSVCGKKCMGDGGNVFLTGWNLVETTKDFFHHNNLYDIIS